MLERVSESRNHGVFLWDIEELTFLKINRLYMISINKYLIMSHPLQTNLPSIIYLFSQGLSL